MTLESKENYPRHTKTVQNSLGFMPEVEALHKPRGGLVLCTQKIMPKSCVWDYPVPGISPLSPTDQVQQVNIRGLSPMVFMV